MLNVSNNLISSAVNSTALVPVSLQQVASTVSSNVTEVSSAVFNAVALSTKENASTADSVLFTVVVLALGWAFLEKVNSFFGGRAENSSNVAPSVDQDPQVVLEVDEFEPNFDEFEPNNEAGAIALQGEAGDHPNLDNLGKLYVLKEWGVQQRTVYREQNKLSEAAQMSRMIDDVKEKIEILRKDGNVESVSAQRADHREYSPVQAQQAEQGTFSFTGVVALVALAAMIFLSSRAPSDALEIV